MAIRDSRMSPIQAGFRPGCDCVDHIITLRMVLKISNIYPPLGVDRTVHWRMMEEYDGVPEKIIRLIKRMSIYVYGEFIDKNWCLSRLCRFPYYAINWIMDTAFRPSRGIQINPEHHITDFE
ncbi:unnamed protein product [Dracunculus medinensis]|uniref:Ovule protein n=1 Tax=Dracunculus medinensis TaxID=318479 RepID=A0A0N4UQ67_DRAME|nr:unnamed protein product [Dracunculus medinensis]